MMDISAHWFVDNAAWEVRYKAEQPRFRFAWDDELSDYNYKCRTLLGGFDTDNPPAVLRFAPSILPTQSIGDYRVNLEKDPTWRWKETIIHMNGGGEVGERAWGYLVGPSRAQFNTTGWARMAYLGMCGNEVNVLERAGGWVRFETLKPADWLRARSMSRATHPTLIHSFHCVTWDRETQTTRHIESTGTPRGVVWYPVVTWEGSAWIPERFVVNL
jgi:hypothetical protein